MTKWKCEFGTNLCYDDYVLEWFFVCSLQEQHNQAFILVKKSIVLCKMNACFTFFEGKKAWEKNKSSSLNSPTFLNLHLGNCFDL